MKKIVFIGFLVIPVYLFYNHLEIAKYNTIAMNSLRIAMKGQMECMKTQMEFCRSEKNVICGADNRNPDSDIVFTILHADASNYLMEVYHVNGTKIFTGTLDESYEPKILTREKQNDSE